jgi:threonine/homoserine efflux transporter RhtA
MTVKSSPPPRDHFLRAILAILFSVACFSVLNAISKTLTQHYPVIQVIWARYLFAFVFMMALFLPRSGLALFRWHNIGTQAVRGLLLFLSSFLYFHGLVYLPLATAAAISLTSPLVVTALSSRFLGEPVGPDRWIAVVVGFVGALIVVRPAHAGFEWHSLLIVASTLCSAFYQLFSRRYGQAERPDASATMATIVGSVAAAPLLPFELGDAGLRLGLAAVREHRRDGGRRSLFPDHRLQPGAGRRHRPLQLRPADRCSDPGLPGVRQRSRLLDLCGCRGDRVLRPLSRARRAAALPSAREQDLTRFDQLTKN